MGRSFGTKTSRVFDLDAKSLQLLVARSGKAITDAEGILLQDLQAYRIEQLSKTQTFSGCIDLPPMVLGDQANCLIIPAFRALVGSNLVYVQGTQNPYSPENSDNLVYIPNPPTTGYGIVVVYLEVWSQMLDESLTNPSHGFFPNNYDITVWDPRINPRYFYPYGNTLASEFWIRQSKFIDDLKDPLAGYTSGRVQLQYAIRARQIVPSTNVPNLTDYFKDFGITHPSLGGKTFTIPLHTLPFEFAGSEDPGLYISSDAQNTSLRSVDSKTYAIPLGIIYQRNMGVWDPFTNAHGSATLGVGTIGSGRPDGKLATKLYPDDILDTRSSFLGGSLEDYESTIRDAATRLWQGSLRLKLAEPPSSDLNAHQLGQTLLSQEFIGPGCTSPYKITSPMANIATNTLPRTCWTSDDMPEHMTFRVTQDMRNSEIGVTQGTTWSSGDTVTLTVGDTSSRVDSVVIYTTNAQAQILRVAPVYISVSGLGTSSILLSWGDMSADPRFDTANPVWVVAQISRTTSIEHLRYVPTTLHTPIYVTPSMAIQCGRVSDFVQDAEEFSAFDTRIKLKSYKRSYDPNIFGTVRKVRIYTQDLVEHQKSSDALETDLTSTTVAFDQTLSSTSTANLVTISWKVTNAQRVTLLNNTTGLAIGEVPLQGSLTVRLTQQTEFILYVYTTPNADPVSKSLTVDPPTDLVSSGSTVITSGSKSYAYPGGSLNPENITSNYTVIPASFFASLPGLGDPLQNVLLGCFKATLHQVNQITGAEESTDLTIRYQTFSNTVTNTALGSFEMAVFGWFSGSSSDYVELELLCNGLKTFHFNPSVQGITGITETLAIAKNSYLFFNTSSSSRPYNTVISNNYTRASVDMLMSVPVHNWQSLQAGGVFEGLFGFNGNSFVFVMFSNGTSYRLVPCTVEGLGTPLLRVSIPNISVSTVEDILVLVNVSTPVDQDSTTLISYNYVPYQGEGSSSEDYHLVYLNDSAVVTTSGTGLRTIPGITNSAFNMMMPISYTLPSGLGWKDSDLSGDSLECGGISNNIGNSALSVAPFVKTTPMTTSVGNLEFLLSEHSVPTLSPRGPAQRGFSNNIMAFSYAVDPPMVTTRQIFQNKDLVFFVDQQNGLDTNPGHTRDSAKQSLQATLEVLPEVITGTVIINISGSFVGSDSAKISVIPATPYGFPTRSSIYALIHSSFKTEAGGLVTIRKDPASTSRPTIIMPDTPFLSDMGVYSWLHTGGRIRLESLELASVSGITFAAYPGSEFSLYDCILAEGKPQILAYGAKGSIAMSSFTSSTNTNIIVSSGGQVELQEGVSLVKDPTSDGYTLVVEKNSGVNITKPLILSGYAPGAESNIFGPELLVRQYSTLDTSGIDGFEFPFGSVRVRNNSTIRYAGIPWYGAEGTPVFDATSSAVELSTNSFN